MKTVLLLLLLTTTLTAQTLNSRTFQPFVSGNVSLFQNLGYRNPVLGGSAGADVETRRLFLTVQANANWDRKIETGDGHNYGVDFGAYVRLGRALIGAGDRWSYVRTSAWSKSEQRVFIGAGYDGEKCRILMDYLLPPISESSLPHFFTRIASFDTQNALQGPRVTVEMMASKHVRVMFGEGIYRYHDTRVSGVDYGINNPAGYHIGGETTGAVKWVF